MSKSILKGPFRVVAPLIFITFMLSTAIHAEQMLHMPAENTPLVSIAISEDENLPEQPAAKPLILIPRLHIEAISNSWGEVSLDSTTIHTHILVNNPHLHLIPMEVDCSIYLNDIEMVSGLGKDLQIEECASGSSIRFTSRIDNENIMKWWVSHIMNGEKTQYRLGYILMIKWLGVRIANWPNSIEGSFETDFFGNKQKQEEYESELHEAGD
ncbi:hypothetical protein IBX65_05795 [Candidatus Aerophobetes bacterium]|nr:hypothetical protein [Candidatus Aerophobetes bacterium]